nr:ribonuclease H-like domain-containing protein [Tanacetum cinerariifolium]
MSMTIHFSIKARILEAQSEASKDVNASTKMLKGLDKQLKRKEDGGLYLAERIWVLAYGNLRTLIMNKAHATRHAVFGKRNKLSPRYVGPFEIVESVGLVAYRLRLPQELVGVHERFHVSNLKKFLADANLHVPLEEVKIDDKLLFVEEPMEIMDREFWRTASVKTLDNGEIKLNATVDGQDKTITEASVRRHLKLADANGISTLPTTKTFEQLALMGIEQYFLMTDYSLWERLAKKNKLKAYGTLLMALPDKHQLKFNIHKDGKTLMEAIEKMFGGNKETKKFLRSLPTEWRTHTLIWRNKTGLEEQSLDDLFNSLKIYEAEVKSSSSASTSTQNIAFVSSSNTDSTNEPVSAATNVSAVSAKIYVSALLNIDADDLEEMDLKWQIAMLTVTARRFLQRTGRNLGANGPTSMGFDMSKVECYNYHKKGHFARECRSPKDTRRNGAAESQRRNVLVETSTSNALVSQCDGVGSYDWSFQAEEEPTNYALIVFTSSSSSSDHESDESLPPSPIYDRYQSGDGYHDVPLPYIGTFMPPRSDLVFHDAPNVNETAHTTFNLELSPSKTNKDFSHTYRPSARIIEDWVSDSEDDSEAKIAQIAPSFVQPTEHVKTPRPSIKTIETSIPTVNPKTAITKPTSNGNRSNRKACFVCKSLDHLIKDCDFFEKKIAQTPARNHVQRGDHQQYARMTLPILQNHVIPTTVLIESKLVPIIAARPVTVAISKPYVTRPRQAKSVVTKPHSLPRRHINHSPSPKASNFPPKVTVVKVPQVNAAKRSLTILFLVHGNPQHAFKDKEVINSGCSRHMTWNMSYLSDFEELNGRYVAFGGNPKGGKIFGKGKIRTGKLDFNDVYFIKELKFNLFSVSRMCKKKNNVLFTDTEYLVLSPEFKLPDENQVLLRVPRKNNMYNVDLKNIVSFRDLTYLFAKATLDESNLWHRRLGHINFKTMNKLVKGIENQLSLKGIKREFSVPRTPQQNGIAERKNRTLIEAARTMLADSLLPILFWAEEPEFEGRKPQSKVYVSLSSSAQTKEHDDKTKRKAKGKSPVESSRGYRNLSVEFEDFSDNSINEVNAVDSSVPAIGQISTNSTNTFSAVGPSNAAVSPTHRKSSYMDTSQLHDDPNMPELEDITYYDDEEDVGAEADFTNLEKKLSQSMTRVAKDQGGLSQINNDNFHTCMFSSFLSQEEPKREEGIDYEEVFAPVARIEAIRGKIDQTLFIKRQKVDILLMQIYVDDIIFGSTNKDLCKAFEKLIKDKFQMSLMGELTFFLGLQVKQKQDGIFISQDKYVAEILRKFGLTYGKSASTPIDTEKPLLKDPDVKRIFRYLKGKPHLGLWYPKDSPFNLVAYSDSDYAGASLDKKSITRGCQFLGCRLISWQCKKQTVVATSSTEAKYVAAASCCAQVALSSVKSLKMMLHVTNILSAG